MKKILSFFKKDKRVLAPLLSEDHPCFEMQKEYQSKDMVALVRNCNSWYILNDEPLWQEEPSSYFVCPKHNAEACMFWLGLEQQFKRGISVIEEKNVYFSQFYNKDFTEWLPFYTDEKKWSKEHIFMQEDKIFRVNPKYTC